jgi:Sulfotransferase domain
MHGRSMTKEYSDSFVLLTLHKAGSSYVGEIFKEVFGKHGYSILDPATVAFELGLELTAFIAGQAAQLCQPHYFYGPFRGGAVCLIGQISPARPIIHIRDPRDCVVSLYYSWRYSHPVPSGEEAGEFLRVREFLKAKTPDDFVRSFVRSRSNFDQAFLKPLQAFRALKESRPDAILSKYEDMVGEFPDWLVGIVEQFGIEIDYEMIIDLIARTDFLVNLRVEENPYNHKRQITPGDHKRKLDPKTQEILTDFFAEELRYFGYL